MENKITENLEQKKIISAAVANQLIQSYRRSSKNSEPDKSCFAQTAAQPMKRKENIFANFSTLQSRRKF